METRRGYWVPLPFIFETKSLTEHRGRLAVRKLQQDPVSLLPIVLRKQVPTATFDFLYRFWDLNSRSTYLHSKCSYWTTALEYFSSFCKRKLLPWCMTSHCFILCYEVLLKLLNMFSPRIVGQERRLRFWLQPMKVSACYIMTCCFLEFTLSRIYTF